MRPDGFDDPAVGHLAARHLAARLCVLLTLALATSGCGGAEEEPAAPTGPPINTRGPRASLMRQEAPTEQAAPTATAPTPAPATPVAAPAAAAETKPAEKPKPRDYSDELVRAVGGAEGCVKQRLASAPLPEKTSVSLEAYVLESGAVSRGYARSPHLSAEELDCVKQRIEHARFAPAVEGAPRRVDATVQLTFKRPEPPGTTPAAGAKGAPAGAPAAMPAAPTAAPAAAATPKAPSY